MRQTYISRGEAERERSRERSRGYAETDIKRRSGEGGKETERDI